MMKLARPTRASSTTGSTTGAASACTSPQTYSNPARAAHNHDHQHVQHATFGKAHRRVQLHPPSPRPAKTHDSHSLSSEIEELDRNGRVLANKCWQGAGEDFR